MNTILAPRVRVTVVTIMYGDRWKFLSQVVEVVMKDVRVTKLIIVDNGSKNKEEIENGVEGYGDRVVILRQEKNLGSAGGFAVGLDYARGTDCDFVFILDDDSVPEDGAISLFLETLRFFPDKKIVLHGNRVNIPGNEEYFHYLHLVNKTSNKTFFEVFSFEKIIYFLEMFITGGKKNTKSKIFVPIIPNNGFVYGGTFLPIEAVQEAPLPDASLFLYGDDLEYSWGVMNLGYKVYLCFSPKIYDVDLTFGEGSHVFGLFDPKTLSFKVYYRIRNMVRISARNSPQGRVVLFLNVFVWILGLCLLGIFKYGPTRTYFKRVKLIVQAVYGGYIKSAKIPKEAQLS